MARQGDLALGMDGARTCQIIGHTAAAGETTGARTTAVRDTMSAPARVEGGMLAIRMPHAARLWPAMRHSLAATVDGGWDRCLAAGVTATIAPSASTRAMWTPNALATAPAPVRE